MLTPVSSSANVVPLQPGSLRTSRRPLAAPISNGTVLLNRHESLTSHKAEITLSILPAPSCLIGYNYTACIAVSLLEREGKEVDRKP